MSNLFVVALGIGTVFSGLIIIIILCKLMSFFVRLTETNEGAAVPAVATAAPKATAVNAPIADKQPLLAAISAVVAEELGTDISNIRIHSIKRV